MRKAFVVVTGTGEPLPDAPLYRLQIEPNAANGRKAPSQAMVDKIVAMPREKCGAVMGGIDDANVIALDRMLSVIIGHAD